MASLWVRRLYVVLVLLSAIMVLERPAFASSFADGEPTIEKGREADFLALLAPYELGGEVSNGFRLWTVSLQPRQATIGLRGPDDQQVSFTLVHPTRADSAAIRTASFAMESDVADVPGARVARAALMHALSQNDDGQFWKLNLKETLWLKASRPPHRGGPLNHAWYCFYRLVSDGFILSLAGVFLTTALAARVLVTAPRFVRLALPFVVAVGIALRLLLSPVGFLGAWPWTRIWPNVGTIWKSEVFVDLVSRLGTEVYFTDLSFSVNFVYACLMPLVLFAHASQLLGDPRAGLAAAAMVALSPHHIRYSRSEDAFVPSLVLTSLAFALIHTFMRDSSRAWRIVAVLALPFALWSGYLLRPLNILFVAVYLGAIFLLHSEKSPRHRRVVAAAVVVGVWAAALVDFLHMYADQVADGTTNLLWLLQLPRALLSPSLNMLIHPLATAPALLVAAVLGTLWLRDRGERRLALFLLGWLGGFFVLHLYVTSEPMQPRYHLHLLVPFMLLASTAVVEAFRRLRRGWLLVSGISVALAPLLSMSWIQNVGYTDTLEYAFIRHARDLIPEGCTVLEFVNVDGPVGRDDQFRFKRIAERIANGEHEPRFSTIAVKYQPTGDPAELEPAVREALSADGACVYIYEGVGCWGNKRPEERYAPACTALTQAVPLETVLEEWIPFREYDRNVTTGVTPGTTDLRLALSRVVSRAEVADGQ